MVVGAFPTEKIELSAGADEFQSTLGAQGINELICAEHYGGNLLQHTTPANRN